MLCRILRRRCVDPAAPACLQAMNRQTRPLSRNVCLRMVARVENTGLVGLCKMGSLGLNSLITDPLLAVEKPVRPNISFSTVEATIFAPHMDQYPHYLRVLASCLSESVADEIYRMGCMCRTNLMDSLNFSLACDSLKDLIIRSSSVFHNQSLCLS